MPGKRPIPLSAETLWKIDRIGAVSLAPDGQRAVCSVTGFDATKNESRSALWLLDTTGVAAPRQLTRCGAKDGQPAWSPRGDRIAFVAKREQGGKKDETAQLYLIAPDGGEATRASDFGPGIESFKWLPDGKRIVFTAWVWPHLKTAAAQCRQHKQWKARKETGYVTAQAFYRYWDHFVPMGRVLHLLLLDVASGRITDLFAGTRLELPRVDEGSAGYDLRPDGKAIAFVHDPAAVPRLGNPLALVEMDLKTRRVKTLAQDAAWDFGGPRYSPDGQQLAAVAAHVGQVHTAHSQLVLLDLQKPRRPWRVLAAQWLGSVDASLRWTTDGRALHFTAEERGRCHVWWHDIHSGSTQVAHAGGWVQGFDLAAGVLLVAADSARHPVRVHARCGTQQPQRVESFNDALLAQVELGEVKEVAVRGALGDEVQMWLTFPPAFNPKHKHPVTHLIHGGPHAAAGDTFGYRWNPHVFASRGHVIAQVNFHGSTGFGHAFKHSLIGRQGELELQDIEAGTDWLLTQRWADKNRVFATGGSYGGFLVAWMNGHVPAWPVGRYRAYICHAGVFDRVATFSADSYPVRPKDLAANYWQDLPRVLAQSPATFAGAMNTPTLVIHGAQDYRVPDCNGLAYYNTLKARGVDARLLWFADENHWVLQPQNSLLWYREFMAWLDAHSGAPRKVSAR